MATRSLRQILLSVLLAPLLVASCGGGSPTAPEATADFAGVWQGTWIRTGCTETGGAVGAACATTPSTGSVRLTLTQADSSVQGSVEVAAFAVAVSGSVDGGTMALNGEGRNTAVNATATISNWTATRNGSAMNGTFTLRISAFDPAFGSQTVQASLQNVSKVS